MNPQTIAALQVITLLLLSDDASADSPSHTIHWLPIDGATGYQVAVEQTPQGVNSILVVSATTCDPFACTANIPITGHDNYSWQVRSTSPSGWGRWSKVGHITYQADITSTVQELATTPLQYLKYYGSDGRFECSGNWHIPWNYVYEIQVNGEWVHGGSGDMSNCKSYSWNDEGFPTRWWTEYGTYKSETVEIIR